MQRRHFELIAETLRGELDHASDLTDRQDRIDTVVNVAEAFADKLASMNPNFDLARFLRACGVES